MSVKILAASMAAVLCCTAQAAVTVFTPEQGGIPNLEYEGSEAPEITIASYNMAAGRVGSLDEIAYALKALKADIISLNEVDKLTGRSGRVDQLYELAHDLGYYYAFGKAIDFDGGEYGVGILSRYPISGSKTIKLPSGEEEQRVVLIAEIQAPDFDSPIMFMSTHLDWHEDHVLQGQQVREINNLVVANTDAGFAEFPSRIKILAGDFNDTYNGPALKELSRYWDLVTDSDPYKMRTWPAANPGFDLDHIMTSRGQIWEVEDLEVKGEFADGIEWAKTADHLPIVVKMRLLEQ